MEYVQMTLDDWVEMKRKLRQELQGVKQSFVRIGYALRKIDDQELYKQEGRQVCKQCEVVERRKSKKTPKWTKRRAARWKKKH